MENIVNFWVHDEGQDLIEYTLLISFVALAVVGLFMGSGRDVKQIWTVANNELAQANSQAS
jgi:Flp pilus assembly pilin Flp